MEIKAKTRTQQILIVTHILAWTALAGFIIEGAAMAYTYFISVFYDDGAKNLYNGLNLFELRKYNFWQYTLSVTFRITIKIMQAYTSWLAIKCLLAVKIESPFKADVAQLIERISYFLLSTWIVVMIHNLHLYWWSMQLRDFIEMEATPGRVTDGTNAPWISGEFIFAAGLLFVVAQMFKRGVEIQRESDLTV